jgi:mRNA interferase MazF
VAAPSAGAVVVVRFPFSDLSQSKLRPAVVLANVGRGDVVLCQITSNAYADAKAVEITSSDFRSGSLQRTSYARPGKLFTASDTLLTRQVGQLSPAALTRIVDAVVAILRGAAEAEEDDTG